MLYVKGTTDERKEEKDVERKCRCQFVVTSFLASVFSFTSKVAVDYT